jgi:hypothetical protein
LSAMVHASGQAVLVKRQLQNTGFNLWKRRAFPRQSIHAAVVPAEAERFEFIEKGFQKYYSASTYRASGSDSYS